MPDCLDEGTALAAGLAHVDPDELDLGALGQLGLGRRGQQRGLLPAGPAPAGEEIEHHRTVRSTPRACEVDGCAAVSEGSVKPGAVDPTGTTRTGPRRSFEPGAEPDEEQHGEDGGDDAADDQGAQRGATAADRGRRRRTAPSGSIRLRRRRRPSARRPGSDGHRSMLGEDVDRHDHEQQRQVGDRVAEQPHRHALGVAWPTGGRPGPRTRRPSTAAATT